MINTIADKNGLIVSSGFADEDECFECGRKIVIDHKKRNKGEYD